MTAHSTVVGGSSAERVAGCPASVRLSRELPPKPANVYMLEGTALHAVMEACLLEDTAPDPSMIGQTLDVEQATIEITKDLYYNKIVPAWEATEEAFKRLDVDEFEPEARVHIPQIDGAFGTCDIVAKGRDDLIAVLDYKFGDGHLVSSVENRQLMFYAAGVLLGGEFDEWVTNDPDQPLMLGIIQPAQDNVLNTWQTTAGEVIGFIADLTVQVSKVDTAEPRIGSWCKWCPAQGVCPAKLQTAHAINRLKAEHLNDLSAALALADELEPWIRSVRKLAHEQLERGDSIDGYKLVDKRATRKWVDEQAMLQTLKNSNKFKADEYQNVSMVSPAQFEKLCKSKDVDYGKYSDNVELRSSGTTLAPDDDPRPAVSVEIPQEDLPGVLGN